MRYDLLSEIRRKVDHPLLRDTVLWIRLVFSDVENIVVVRIEGDVCHVFDANFGARTNITRGEANNVINALIAEYAGFTLRSSGVYQLGAACAISTASPPKPSNARPEEKSRTPTASSSRAPSTQTPSTERCQSPA